MYLFIKSIIFIFVFYKKRSIISNLLELENFFYGFLCGFPTSDNGWEFYFESWECF